MASLKVVLQRERERARDRQRERNKRELAITDALLALHAAAHACTAAMTVSGFSEEQAANGRAVVIQLHALFRPRPAVITHPALESAAPLLSHLPKEIVLAILHRLDTRQLARFAITCRGLYDPVPPQQDSVVAVVLRDRGCSVAGSSSLGVPALLRREWRRGLMDRPLTVGAGSAFVDSAGRLLTCGTEGIDLEKWAPPKWVSDASVGRRVLLSPTIVPATRDVRFRCVSCADSECFAVSRAGKVYSWGSNRSGCHLGHDMEKGGTEVAGLTGVRVRSVGVGRGHLGSVYAAVTEDGSLYTWGCLVDIDENRMVGCQTGIGYPASEEMDSEDGDDDYVDVPRQVALSVCVRSVALGRGFTLILANDGRLFSCGAAWWGTLGHGDTEHDVVRPKQIEALQGVHVCAVAAEWGNALALSSDGLVYSWGYGEGTGLGVSHLVLLPTLVETLANERVSMVAVGIRNGCAVTEGGELFTWGVVDSNEGSLGHGDQEPQPTPRRVEALRGCRIVTVTGGDKHMLAAGEDGSVYGFGESSCLGLGPVSDEGWCTRTPKRIPNLKVWLG